MCISLSLYIYIDIYIYMYIYIYIYIYKSKFAQPFAGVRSRKVQSLGLLDCTENTVLSNKTLDFTILAAPERMCARFRCSSSLGATKGRLKTLLGLPRSRRLPSKTLLELARNRLCARIRCSSSLGAIKMRRKHRPVEQIVWFHCSGRSGAPVRSISLLQLSQSHQRALENAARAPSEPPIALENAARARSEPSVRSNLLLQLARSHQNAFENVAWAPSEPPIALESAALGLWLPEPPIALEKLLSWNC